VVLGDVGELLGVVGENFGVVKERLLDPLDMNG